MLSDRVVSYLKPLVYSEFAERSSFVLLFSIGGIYWKDEVPDFFALRKMPEGDMADIYELLRIRYKIWDGESLTDDECAFWEDAKKQVPEYALFRRLTISEEDRRFQEQAVRELESASRVFMDEADEVDTIQEDGCESIELTFDLCKDERGTEAKKPWWKRILRL